MTMAPFARQTRRANDPTRIPTFVPALFLSLVLGAALVFRFSPWQQWQASTQVAPPPAEIVSPVAHHAESNGGAIVVPAGWLSGSEPGHHPTSQRTVREQLTARPDDVTFCVGSTLDPFEAASAQLLAIGPGEAAERMRRCLMELVFTHVDPATAANVRAELPAFGACYQRAIDLVNPSKQQAVAEVSGCLTSLDEQ